MARRKKKRTRTYSGIVKLREKKLANGNRSLYLDMYRHGKRSYQFLGLYLIGDPTIDADTLRLAETKRAQLEIETQARDTGFVPTHLKRMSFIAYFERVAKTKESCNWPNALHYIRRFFGEAVTFEEITPTRMAEFRDFLVEKLYINTAYSYMATTKACLNRAVKEGIITISPAAHVEPIKRVESRRCFLTIEELRTLAQTPCPNETVKRAFLWCCYSGQSRCDVRALKWGQIEGAWLYYTRGKVRDELVAVALPEHALELLGERGQPDDLVFPKLPADRYIGIALTKWSQRAGITKNVTMYVARHTMATLALFYGGDVMTVSRQLGHKHVRTTQTYAKVLDERRRAVADALPRLS